MDLSKPTKGCCGKCSAFAPLTRQCRRRAPQAVPVNVGKAVEAMGIWPATIETNWCLEFVEDEVARTEGASQ